MAASGVGLGSGVNVGCGSDVGMDVMLEWEAPLCAFNKAGSITVKRHSSHLYSSLFGCGIMGE
jgi:hypothetical protein